MSNERDEQISVLLGVSNERHIQSTRTIKSRKLDLTTMSLLVLVFVAALLLSSVALGRLYGRSSGRTSNNNRSSTIDLSRLSDQLFSSIDSNELRLLHGGSIESNVEAANRLETSWRNSNRTIDLVARMNDPVTLSIMSKNFWNGIELIDRRRDQMNRNFSCRSVDDLIVLSNLVETGQVVSDRIIFVNYGRPEDFSLFIRRNLINWNDRAKIIVFLRRNERVFPLIEQIRMINHYKFSALVLFDDPEKNEESEIDQFSIVSELDRLESDKEREDFLQGSIEIDERQVPTLLLSFVDVEQIFRLNEKRGEDQIEAPRQWNVNKKSLPLVRSFEDVVLRLTVHFEEIPVVLPNLFALIRGREENDRLLLVSFRLDDRNQEKIIEQLIRSFETTIRRGWRPKRSILFAGWSDHRFDFHSVRHWIEENFRCLDRHLIGLIDLGNQLEDSSVVNIHGSALLEDLSRQSSKFISDRGQFSLKNNQNRTTLEMIERKNRVASIFLNELGVPSILVETKEPSDKSNAFILPQDLVALVEFLLEMIRRLIDEPRIPFFVSNLADRIERRSEEFLSDFGSKIDFSSKKINSSWSREKFRSTMEDLSRTIRRFDVRFEEKLRSNEFDLPTLNEQLIQFERFFRVDDQPSETKIFQWNNKNLLDGLAFQRPNRLVFLARLRNILVEVDENSAIDLHRTLSDRFEQFESKIRSIQRTLSGLDSLFF